MSDFIQSQEKCQQSRDQDDASTTTPDGHNVPLLYRLLQDILTYYFKGFVLSYIFLQMMAMMLLNDLSQEILFRGDYFAATSGMAVGLVAAWGLVNVFIDYATDELLRLPFGVGQLYHKLREKAFPKRSEAAQ